MNEQLHNLFKLCPYNITSEFERENFNDQTGPAYIRYVIATVNQIRKIDSDLLSETRPFETACLNEKKQTLEKFLLSQDIQSLESSIPNWEMLERDYWTDYLGKIAAIELLTYGKLSVETMTKMAKLPEELYIKATQHCVKLANTIKQATQAAEEQIGIGQEEAEDYPDTGLPDDTSNSAPSTIILKKIK